MPSQLTSDLIWSAYIQGWFPMSDDEGTIEWYQPRQRALFPISGLHVSRSLQKVIDRQEFEVRFDTSFEAVIRGCRRPEENWIDEEIIRAYTKIAWEGWAHCCETWKGDRLVGGVYGLAIGSCFCAESMFHRETNASKVALWAMIEKCRQLGFVIFDAQIMNSHLASLGAYEVPHKEYLEALQAAAKVKTAWS